MRCFKLDPGPGGRRVFWAEHDDRSTTLLNGFQDLVRDGDPDLKVSDVDAAVEGLPLQPFPQGAPHKVPVVVGVGDEDVVVKVPVLREAILHPTKGVEAEQKVLFLSQDHGKETGDKEKE